MAVFIFSQPAERQGGTGRVEMGKATYLAIPAPRHARQGRVAVQEASCIEVMYL